MHTGHCQAIYIATVISCFSLIVLNSLLHIGPTKPRRLTAATRGIEESKPVALATHWQPSEAAIAQFSGLPDRRRGAGSR